MSALPTLSMIGVGRIGLCFSLTASLKGFDVLGLDVSPVYAQQLNEKSFVADEPGVNEALAAATSFRATTSMDEVIAHSNLIFICVDTPTTGGEHQYDHSKLSRVLVQLNKRKLVDSHVVITCTVMPGYIHTIGRHLLRDCVNTTLSYNPAFVAQGDIMKGYETGGYFSMVLIGADSDAAYERIVEVYRAFGRDVPSPPSLCRMSPESAELTKLASNCFRTMKISFANMIGDIADRTPGANKDDIADALGCDDSIGRKCIRPGYSYGGPCYPRDNVALAVYANSVGIKAHLAEASDVYNSYHSNLMAEDLLSQDLDVYVFEDVTYKPNCAVPMIDNSPKLAIARYLAKKGRKVVVRDRPTVLEAVRIEYGTIFDYEEY